MKGEEDGEQEEPGEEYIDEESGDAGLKGKTQAQIGTLSLGRAGLTAA